MTAAFISYSRQDQEVVRRLHAALEARGRDAWVDWQGIPPTAEWMAEIRAAIDAADAALFVISPAWVASAVCADELAHAVQQGKRLVPVVCRDAPAGSVPDALARLNWILLREGDDVEAGMQRLLAALDVDLDWVREHTRLTVRAQEWQNAQRDDARLLRGRELDAAERWLAAGATHTDPAPTALQAAYIGSSRAAAQRRRRVTSALVAAAFAVAIGLAVWAVIERGNALDSAARAIAEEQKARENEARAVRQEGIARAQTQLAQEQTVIAQQQTEAARTARDAEQTQREAAEQARQEAERQRDEAVRQRIAAQARQLAARAQAQPAADPALGQKAALLAAESLRLQPNLDADQVLRATLARLPVRQAELPHAGIADPGAVDGDEGVLAYVDTQGVLHVVDAGRLRETFRHTLDARVRHLHVDRAGRYVLLDDRDGTVLLFGDGRPGRRIPDCGAVGAAYGGPRATLLAIGCRRELRLIDAADASVPARVFEAAAGTQLALAFSRDGERLAGVDEKGDVTVWNVADGRRIAGVRGQESTASTWSRCCTAFIAWSASGDYLAANNLADDRLHVIATRSWETHARLPHGAVVNAFAFDERRDLLASGDRAGTITVWDVPARSIVARMAHADEITHLALHASPSDGGDRAPELLSASSDRTARVWDPFSGAELARAAQPTAVIRVQRPWEPHFGRRFVSLDTRTGLVQWDGRPQPALLPLVVPRGERATPPLHCSEANGTRHWFTDASRMVGWDTTRAVPRIEGRFFGGGDGRPVALDPACGWLALAGGGELRVVDPADPRAQAPRFRDALGAGGGDGWWRSPRGRLLVLRDAREGARVWRTAPWARLAAGDDCRVADVLPAPSEEQVALACGDSLRVLEVASGRETARLAAPGVIALTDDGRVVQRTRDALALRQLPSGRLLATAPLPAPLQRGSAAVDASGRWIAVAGGEQVGLWSLATLQRRSLEQRPPVPSAAGPRPPFEGTLAFGPDGRQLLLHGFDRLFVFDTEPWALRSELIHAGEASLLAWDLPARRLYAQVAFRPENRDTQYSVRAWQLDTGSELLRASTQRAAAALSLSADRRFLLAEQLHRLSPDELRAAACRLVARNLTRREWQAELGGEPYRATCPALPEPPAGTASWDQ